MLKNRIIPCLDVKNGRVVKGINFVELKDAGDPVEQAKIYSDGGADEICFLDITASNENRDTIIDIVKKTAKEFIQFRNKRKEVENQINVLIDKQKSLIKSRDDIDFNEEELINLQEGLSTREQSLHVQQQFEKFYKKNFLGRSNDLVALETLTNQLKIKEGEYTTEQNNSLLLMEEKRMLMNELGIFEDEQRKKRKKDSEDDGDVVDVAIGLPESEFVSNRMQEIEDEIAFKTQELQQKYVDGRIATEGQLQQEIFDMKFEMYQKELELINMSSVAHNQAAQKLLVLQVKQRTERQKSFESSRDAYEKEQAASKKKQEQEDAEIQNIIMNAKTAEEALANLLTMKVNEILLEAMASLWKDGSIPFLAIEFMVLSNCKSISFIIPLRVMLFLTFHLPSFLTRKR